MNTGEIRTIIKQRADDRFGETIEKMFFILRSQHTHKCSLSECDCEYCRFIRNDYVDAKLALHRIKKRLNYYQYLWDLTFDDEAAMLSLNNRRAEWLKQVVALKQHKRDLKENIL